MLPPVKKKNPSSVVLIHQNPLLKLFWTVFTCKRCLNCAYFSPDSDKKAFSLKTFCFCRKQWCKVKNILMIDLLFTNMQLFTRFHLMDWSHVEYCDVFYQLFGLSFWRHPFTAEDLLISQWCNAKFLHIFFTWRSKVILSGKKVSKFSENV